MTDAPEGEEAADGHEITYVSEVESKVMETEDEKKYNAKRSPKRTISAMRTNRRDHLQSLIVTHQAMMKYSAMKLDKMDAGKGASFDTSSLKTEDSAVKQFELDSNKDSTRSKADERLKIVTQKMAKTKYIYPVEVRIKGLSFQAKVNPDSQKIRTVYNSSIIYKINRWCKRVTSGEKRPPKATKTILEDVNLVLHPGKMYLLLGPPGCGKSSFLKAVAGRLEPDGEEVKVGGTVQYNGQTLKDKSKCHIDNAVAYIDQLDNHAPRLTVEETFEFAYQCKTAGVPPWKSLNDQDDHFNDIPDKERPSWVAIGLEILGLTHVKDTFVGDSNVRGVSGGQRRRVTVGEMIMDRTPLLCGDEISTGLDAASTYEIVDLITYYGRLQRTCRVIALLQPSPECVALFDEVLVMAEGKLLYAGPIGQSEIYFESLGYHPPDSMDVADFLQMLSTPDAAALWTPTDEDAERTRAYSVDELAQKFKESAHHKRILDELEAPSQYTWNDSDGNKTEQPDPEDPSTNPNMLSKLPGIKQKYANSFLRAVWLNLQRALVLWIRDRRVFIANGIKNAVMGLSVGGVFWQTTDVVSILGVLFQSMLFIMLGASTAAPALVDDRIIFRKHYEANFFSGYPFIIGRSIAQMPQTLMDVLIFGSILYGMVGLHASFVSYIVFIAILFSFSLLINQLMAVFASRAGTKATVQVVSAVILLLGILFGGFIVPPSVIPKYYLWVYWWNPFAWAYRALLVLEFQSSSWDNGDQILISSGFTDPHGQPFQMEWVWYWFAYMIPSYLFYTLLAAHNLNHATTPGGNPVNGNEETISSEDRAADDEEKVEIPFKPVTLTFEDICYDVKTSTGNEKLRLLSNVNGIFQAGRMCALMGSSGAGKTTLMDVIALRKSSGTVSGQVRINGFPQEAIPFRRSSGYVEQFDVQSCELTVKETILYSARLRLGEEQVKTDKEKIAFVERVMKTLELSSFADSLVGNAETGGLSFEQKKRLSIAVELAASPSILFLDEPTSGLDARSALLVVKLLRLIASEGRTICATIHQPSSQVFEMFDDLLLLKKGGRVVYFGELGAGSKSLTNYFEARGAQPIDRGENPANWVLTALSAESKDYAEQYLESEQYRKVKEDLAAASENPDPAKQITYEEQFAASRGQRSKLTNNRLMTIYWRSPTYNLSRITVSIAIAFILGSVLIADRNQSTFTETEMRAQFAVIFLSFIIVGIMSIFTVLPVMLGIRDMFYRHRASGMIGSYSVGWALGYSEKGFILFSSVLFVLIFVGISYNGDESLRGRITFWGFFTFNIALYSYFGQAFVCFFKPMATAQILASVFIGLNNFFSGLIVRPQFLVGFFAIPYYITPGHYVYEGLITSLYHNDTRTVMADYGTDFYDDLGCEFNNITIGECQGTATQFMDSFYGGKFHKDNMWLDFVVLGGYLTLARFLTFLALHFINFSAT